MHIQYRQLLCNFYITTVLPCKELQYPWESRKQLSTSSFSVSCRVSSRNHNFSGTKLQCLSGVVGIVGDDVIFGISPIIGDEGDDIDSECCGITLSQS